MKISLIIPTFNRGHLISETIESVISQTYKNWECIIVDDGSIDNTGDIVKDYVDNYENIYYFHRPVELPKGANSCRNFGLSVSKGELINWLDSDDILDKSHFQTHLDIHVENNNLCASISSANTFMNKVFDLDAKWSNIYPTGDEVEDMISGKISWPTPGVVWKKTHLKNLFNPKLQSSQEWTFHTLKLIEKINFKISDKTTIYVRRHEDRIGKSISKEKYFSRFYSRFIVYNKLRAIENCNKKNEYYLLVVMIQALKGAVKNKYDLLIFKLIYMLMMIFVTSKYKLNILKIIFFSVPVYRLFGKGEGFFKLQKY